LSTKLLSAEFAGIADALVAVSAMPALQISAAASFLRFDMLVSSGISAWKVATRELLLMNSGRGVSVPCRAGQLLESVNRGMSRRMRTVRSLRTAALALVGALAGTSALAQGAQYTTLAYGGIKCAEWSNVRSSKPTDAAVYEAWILGFLSAYNAFVFKGPNVAAGTDFDSLRNMVDAHCKAHPQDDLDSSAQGLIKDLLKKNPG
jgi:hypothetical protein